MNNATEQHLLELAENFKEQMKVKNKLICELKKLILTLYGLVRVADEQEDIQFVSMARTYLSDSLNKYFGVEEDDDDDI